MANWTHEFSEAGNGFPGVDELVIEELDGDIRLLVIKEISRIHTIQWQANYVYLVCEEADENWDEWSEKKQDRNWERLCHVSPIAEESEAD